MSFRITDVDCIGRAKTPQLNLPGVVWWPNVYIYIYISILWHPSCARRRPGTVTAVPSYGPHWRGCRPGPLHAGTFTRVPGGVSSLATDPPGTPVAPCKQKKFLHLFRWYTHTPRNSRADEMTVKMTWKWKWNESYLTRTRRGERKRRGKEQTPTRHTWPETGKNLGKARKKKKRRPMDTDPDQRRRGRTEAPEPT